MLAFVLAFPSFFSSNSYFTSSRVFLWTSINLSSNVSFTCESSYFTFESSSVAVVNFCSAAISISWAFSSCVERITPDRLLLVEPKIEVGVGPNPYPRTRPCLSGTMTWVYISSTYVDATDVDATDVNATDVDATVVDATDVDDTDVDAPDDAEVEKDVPSGWDSNCWNWSWNYKK